MKKLFTIIIAVVLLFTACGPSPEKLVEQGRNYYNYENYAEAMICFEKAANKNNAEAQYYIGDMYDNGLGVEKDSELAADWYLKSAKNGFGNAQNDLAVMYYTGIGVSQNYEKAAQWANQALSQKDYSESQLVLGVLYYAGMGVQQSYNKAAEYLLPLYNKNKYIESTGDLLFVMYLNGWGVTQSDDKALDILVKLMNISRTEAMFGIASAYYQGIEQFEQDYSKAAKWYRRAADDGNSEAQLMMANLYENGQGVNKSLTERFKWLQKAANNGNMIAQEKLADAYLNGEGVNKDFDKAKYWWRQAANQGSEEAKQNIELAESIEYVFDNLLNRYSVSPGKKVQFSKGNLQYQASTKTWRFAANQWDYIGEANKNISSSYSGWIDLFGWGTGNNPTNTSMNADDYAKFNDWGKNTITNGRNKKWRTLTKDEWVYLMDRRQTDSGVRFALAIVNDVPGIVLLPDNWARTKYSLNNVNNLGSNYESNHISKNDWVNKLEPNGAIFLPAAGSRYGTTVQSPRVSAQYWSSTPIDNYAANNVWTAGALGGTAGTPNRILASSVRLVCDL